MRSIHFQQAEKWLYARKTSLKTLDSIHVACCLKSRATLITCDGIMHCAAESLGLKSELISPDGNR